MNSRFHSLWLRPLFVNAAFFGGILAGVFGDGPCFDGLALTLMLPALFYFCGTILGRLAAPGRNHTKIQDKNT